MRNGSFSILIGSAADLIAYFPIGQCEEWPFLCWPKIVGCVG